MECWCRVVLLVVSLSVLMCNGSKSDKKNYDNHVCTQFSRFDANGDLILELKDFETIILATAPNGTVFTPEQLRSAATQAASIVPLLDADSVNRLLDEGLSLKEYLKIMRERRFTPKLEQAIEVMVVYLFQSFNADGNDQEMTLHEFTEMYIAFGVAESEIADAFKDIDLNGNGIIELQECIQVAKIYYTEAPLDPDKNSFAGPILTCLAVAKYDKSNLP